MKRLLPYFGAFALLASCGPESTTAPEVSSSEPSLATATTTLAFSQVSGGGVHTCGLTTENRAYCWGYNVYGELGDGTNNGSLTPVPVATALRFRQISSGQFHSCGVATDGRAYCWGYNFYGQLGDGTRSERNTPGLVAGGRQFRQIDAGNSHTCAVAAADNRAYCWGRNSDAQLGDETVIQRLTPVPVSRGLPFRQVSAGGAHTCAITTGNQAYCWGANRHGQVGDDTDRTRRFKPTPVVGGRAYGQVDAGANHTCAVTTTYKGFCWGSNTDGQLGNGGTTPSRVPKAVAGSLNFERVTLGEWHSCGETTTNRAYCWGAGFRGQLGDGTGVGRVRPTAVAGGHFFQQVSAGNEYSCGKASTNVLYCWGDNSFGQLGDGTKTLRQQPVPVANPTSASLTHAAQ